jgi:hypothetical protein
MVDHPKCLAFQHLIDVARQHDISIATLINWGNDVRTQWRLDNAEITADTISERAVEQLVLTREILQKKVQSELESTSKIARMENQMVELNRKLDLLLLTQHRPQGEKSSASPSPTTKRARTSPSKLSVDSSEISGHSSEIRSTPPPLRSSPLRPRAGFLKAPATKKSVSLETAALLLFFENLVDAAGCNAAATNLSEANLKKYSTWMKTFNEKVLPSDREYLSKTRSITVKDMGYQAVENRSRLIARGVLEVFFGLYWPAYAEKNLKSKSNVTVETITLNQFTRARTWCGQHVLTDNSLKRKPFFAPPSSSGPSSSSSSGPSAPPLASTTELGSWVNDT